MDPDVVSDPVLARVLDEVGLNPRLAREDAGALIAWLLSASAWSGARDAAMGRIRQDMARHQGLPLGAMVPGVDATASDRALSAQPMGLGLHRIAVQEAALRLARGQPTAAVALSILALTGREDLKVAEDAALEAARAMAAESESESSHAAGQQAGKGHAAGEPLVNVPRDVSQGTEGGRRSVVGRQESRSIRRAAGVKVTRGAVGTAVRVTGNSRIRCNAMHVLALATASRAGELVQLALCSSEQCPLDVCAVGVRSTHACAAAETAIRAAVANLAA